MQNQVAKSAKKKEKTHTSKKSSSVIICSSSGVGCITIIDNTKLNVFLVENRQSARDVNYNLQDINNFLKTKLVMDGMM
jgi:hypothetical protein